MLVHHQTRMKWAVVVVGLTIEATIHVGGVVASVGASWRPHHHQPRRRSAASSSSARRRDHSPAFASVESQAFRYTESAGASRRASTEAPRSRARNRGQIDTGPPPAKSTYPAAYPAAYLLIPPWVVTGHTWYTPHTRGRDVAPSRPAVTAPVSAFAWSICR